MEAYIVAGYRTAVGKASRGGFRFVNPIDLAKPVIEGLLKAVPNLDPERIDDLIVGNAVPEAEQGLQMARWVAVRSLPLGVPAVTVNRYCGSGVETIAMAAAKIKAGFADCIIAGGTESMSLVPTVGFKTVPNFEVANATPEYFIGMGHTSEKISQLFNVTREAQDEFSYNSHQKAINAIKTGLFKDEIIPVEVEEVYVENNKRKSRKFIVDTDEGPRADTSLEALAKLRPAFSLNGTVTAGNSSQTSDGAAFVLVMSERMVKELGLTPIARMVTCASAGVDPTIMGMGPVNAIPKALKQAGLTLNQIDLIELNEAFAAQSLAVINEAKLNPEVINVNGGAIALGHPLGCSGTKLTVQVLNELRRRNKKYGMVTACIGGGQGIAGIYELLN
jgi:acetyl-CoA acyltransferase